LQSKFSCFLDRIANKKAYLFESASAKKVSGGKKPELFSFEDPGFCLSWFNL